MRTCRQVQAELRSLPIPSARDRALFLQFVERNIDQTTLAARFGLSQGRVSQIVGRIRQWLLAATRPEHRSFSEADQLRQVVADVRMKMNFMLADAWHGWKNSVGDQTTVKTRRLASGDVTETITKRSFGNTTYLAHYRDITIALAKLDGVEFAPLNRRRDWIAGLRDGELIISAEGASQSALETSQGTSATNDESVLYSQAAG